MAEGSSRWDRLFSDVARPGRKAAGLALARSRWIWTASVLEASAPSRFPVALCRLDRLFSELARSQVGGRAGLGQGAPVLQLFSSSVLQFFKSVHMGLGCLFLEVAQAVRGHPWT